MTLKDLLPFILLASQQRDDIEVVFEVEGKQYPINAILFQTTYEPDWPEMPTYRMPTPHSKIVLTP